MMKRRCVSALVVALALGGDVRAERPVSFDREVIRVFVSEGRFRVEGTYVFTTPTRYGGRQLLSYPLPVDSLHPFPDRIRVYSQGDTLAFSRQPDAIRFSISVLPRRETEVHVEYEQPCREPSGCYILTTTSAWQQPLQRADFEIHIPQNMQLESATYPFDEVEQESGYAVHRFSRTDFMPEKDLCIRWRAVAAK